MSTSRTGGCLCQSVTYRLPEEVAPVLHCHCENCRRLTGNFIAAIRVQNVDLDVSEGGQLRWHELGYAKYGFCSGCGSTMFYVAADDPGRTSVTVGTLDDSRDLVLGAVWFADEMQPHNVAPDGVIRHAGNG